MVEREDTPGCPIGNLTIEMSEHDETFRLKLDHFFKRWIVSIETVLEEMVKQNQLIQQWIYEKVPKR